MLNHADYFDPSKNRYLSNSKLGDYLKCPNYFHRKHVLFTVPDKRTDAMLVGSAVDTWLTDGKEAFERKYICVSRRNLKNPAPDVVELNMTQYNQVVALCRAVEATTAYQEVKNHRAQQILSEDLAIGDFKGLCGIPDWYEIFGNECVITDLKTTMNADPIKYYYAALDYGYFRQQAMYQRLVKANNPNVTKFTSRHLVVEKDEDGINRVRAFILDQELIDIEKEIIEITIERIANDKHFKKLNADWDTALVLGQKGDSDEF